MSASSLPAAGITKVVADVHSDNSPEAQPEGIEPEDHFLH